MFHPLIQTLSGEQTHCNASATRDIILMRSRRLAGVVIKVNGVRGELVESLLEDSEVARRVSVDLVDEETAPGLEDARGVLLGVVLGAACWLVIIAAGYLILKVLS